MATVLDRWEKDPFFYAAEVVQESADRCRIVHTVTVSTLGCSFLNIPMFSLAGWNRFTDDG